MQSLPAHATATITLTATPTVAGTSSFRSYARVMYATDNSFAFVTVTAS